MTEAFQNYHNTFVKEVAALIDLFDGLLCAPIPANEVNRQADQHFKNLDHAAAKYYEDVKVEIKKLSGVKGVKQDEKAESRPTD